jgi:hypothetical protein
MFYRSLLLALLRYALGKERPKALLACLSLGEAPHRAVWLPGTLLRWTRPPPSQKRPDTSSGRHFLQPDPVVLMTIRFARLQADLSSSGCIAFAQYPFSGPYCSGSTGPCQACL